MIYFFGNPDVRIYAVQTSKKLDFSTQEKLVWLFGNQKLIDKKMLSKMMQGTVLVDVAIDQGGCFETSEPTTHENPIVIKEGIIHYAVTNMPGAVPNTSTIALTNSTLSYIIKLANKGWKKACQENSSLAKGLNIMNGKVVYKQVAEAFDLDFTEVESLI